MKNVVVVSTKASKKTKRSPSELCHPTNQLLGSYVYTDYIRISPRLAILKQILLLICCFLWFHCTGKVGNQYNINLQNGLPSNNVYNVIKDRYGYLWIATNNGVAKYNGYTFKIFNLSDGLPSADVWSLLEDKEGRIWLGSITNGIGYILHDRYHKVIFPNMHHSVYPTNMVQYKDQVIFRTPYVFNERHTLCIAEHDTIYVDSNHYTGNPILANSSEVSAIIDGKVIDSVVIVNKHFYRKRMASISKAFNYPLDKYNRDKRIYVGKYMIASKSGDTSVNVLNLLNGNGFSFLLPKANGHREILKYVYYRPDSEYRTIIYAITANYIYKVELGTEPRFTASFRIDSLVSVKGDFVSALYEDKSWNCIATTTKGLLINYDNEHYFRKNDISLGNYNYLGTTPGNNFYWWDQSHHFLVRYKNGVTKRIIMRSTDMVYGVLSIGGDSSLLFTNNDLAYQNQLLINNAKVVPFPAYSALDVINMITCKDGRKFAILQGQFAELKLRRGTYVRSAIDMDRYKDILYDSVRECICAYNDNKIYLHFLSGKNLVIEQPLLPQIGVKNIQKILTDKFGDLFLKDNDRLIIFNPATGYRRDILQNYNLTGASIYIHNNVLIVAGGFGVIFIKIGGPGKLLPLYQYQNIKCSYYKYLLSVSIGDNGMLMCTDKGTYQLPFPSDAELEKGNYNNNQNDFTVLIKYNEQIYPITKKDTIKIYPENKLVRFDIINPKGTGTLHFNSGYLKKHLEALNANEMYLTNIAAGEYRHIYVSAYDDIWRSGPIEFTVYIVPGWWQTRWGKNITYVSGILTLISLIFVSIVTTRKVLIRKNNFRNRQLLLELRSIYAQINPHFIFNTLSSAMLLIKQNRTDEAYGHVGRFSRLLRSYLHSSQNRYVTIAEEIDNLRTYIELQQVRFKNKFSYLIDTKGVKDNLDLMIPSLLLQPLVENAINHGLFHKQEEGYLFVGFVYAGNTLTCIIEDDGIGMQASKEMYSNSGQTKESYGSKLIEELISIFNSYADMHISINTINAISGTGTRVEIIVRYNR